MKTLFRAAARLLDRLSHHTPDAVKRAIYCLLFFVFGESRQLYDASADLFN